MYKKYQINEKFFDSIDSEIKAYFLGLLFADGYNEEVRGNIRLALQEKDCKILESLRTYIYPNNDKPLGRCKKLNCNDLLYLEICNKHMSGKLSQLGMVKAKTFKLKFPNIKEKLYSHFIRGYIDGDGCISWFMCNGKHFKCQLRMLGTKDFCESVQDIVNINCKTTGSVRKRGNIFELAYTSRNQVIKVCDYLYKNSNIFLNRKLNKFQEIKNHKDGRFKK